MMEYARSKVLLIIVAGIIICVAAIYALRNHTRLLNDLPPPMRDFIRGYWYGFRVERNIMLPMPDGVRLATNVYFPSKQSAPTGTVLIRLPYGKEVYPGGFGSGESFASLGFVTVVQDVRGKFDSEGIYTPNYLDDQDGAATIDWIVKQPWSNGKVGTYGCSALGESQIVLAKARHPHHTAMISLADGGALGVMPGRLDAFGWYEGGIFNLASGFGWFLESGAKEPGHHSPKGVDVDKAVWGLPSIGLVRRYRQDPTDYERFLGASFTDPHWQDSGYIGPDDRFSTPAIQITTWQDQAVGNTLAISELIKHNADSEAARVHNHVIVAAGNHCDFTENAKEGAVGDLPLGPEARQPYREWYEQWFRYWLLGEGKLPDLPAYLLYVSGEDRWIRAQAWPPAGVEMQRWYLESDGGANSSSGNGTLLPISPERQAVDRFTYDPLHPVPTRGGPFCCTNNPLLRQGSVDQSDVEERADVLVYSSEPLREGVRIVGPLSADLFVSSSAVDTDFVVKIVDVFPDGKSLNIQEGALRMRYRDGYERPTTMVPGSVYRVAVDMRAIGHYFAAGHRIRLQISSSNFPRLERNLNTGGRNFDETAAVVAVNQVWHGAATPSAVVLPVLTDAALEQH